MKEWRKIKLSKKDLKEIENAEKQVQKPQLLKRLQCLKLKNEGWKHEKLSVFFGVSMNTISSWIKAYKEGGIKELLKWNYKGKVSILTLEDKEKIIARNKEKPFNTAKEAKDYIEKHFGITFHLHWVQKLLKKNFDFHTKRQL
jgi:transposase